MIQFGPDNLAAYYAESAMYWASRVVYDRQQSKKQHLPYKYKVSAWERSLRMEEFCIEQANKLMEHLETYGSMDEIQKLRNQVDDSIIRAKLIANGTIKGKD